MLLDKFISKPTGTGFTLNAVRTIPDPILEGYQYLADMEIKSMELIREHTLSTLYGYGDNSALIVKEGLGDMISSAAKFFKELIVKIGEFFKKMMLYMTSMFVSFEKFIDKYKDNLTKHNPSYTIYGYDYTLNVNVPRVDVMTKVVTEFNNEISDVSKLNKEELVERRKTFVHEEQQDALRGAIIGIDRKIDTSDMLIELKKMFRDGKEEEREIKVDRTVIATYITKYKDTKKLMSQARAEREKIEGVYRSLEAFFSKGAKFTYSGNDAKAIGSSVKVNISGKDSSFAKGGDYEYSKTESNVDVINFYYGFKWKQAQTIGSISFQAFIEKMNAFKEAMNFYEKTIRQAIFASSEKKGDDE